MTEFLLLVLFVAVVWQWTRGWMWTGKIEDLASRLGTLEERYEALLERVTRDRAAAKPTFDATGSRETVPRPATRPHPEPAPALSTLPPKTTPPMPAVAPGPPAPAIPTAAPVPLVSTPAAPVLPVSTTVAPVPLVSTSPSSAPVASHPLEYFDAAAAALALAATVRPAPSAAAPPPRTEVPPVRPVTTPSVPVAAARVAATPMPTIAQPPSRVSPIVAGPAQDSLESRIGGRWLLYIGVAAIVIGASYFVKYAIDNAWITPAMRVAFGALAGLVLIAAGSRFVRAGYGFYGQILTGGGVAVLYVCTYAAFNVYHLIGQASAFGLMVAITAAASILADRQHSQGLALMAVGGGFVTPFLVSNEAGSEVALFGYDAILVAGTMYLAHRRAWPALNLVSCVLTTLTFMGWAATSWTPDARWTTQFFLVVFAGMFLYVFRENRRNAGLLATLVGVALAGTVGLGHLACLANLSGHPAGYVTYLVALTLVGLLLVGSDGRTVPRLVLWIVVILPFIGRAEPNVHTLGPGVVGLALAALYGMHVAMQYRVICERDDLGGVEIALIHTVGLGTFAAAYAALSDTWLDAIPIVALSMAIGTIGLAALLRRARLDAALHFTALAATLVAVAAAERFDGAWVIVAWATEGAALLWLGLRAGRTWVRIAGGVLMLLGIVQLLQLLNLPAPVGQRAFVNARAIAGVYAAALLLALARIHRRFDSSPAGVELTSAFVLATTLLATTVFTAEINAYWSARGEGLSDRLAIELARTMSLVAGWMTAGAALVGTGLQRRSTWLRTIGGLVVAWALVPLFLMLTGQTPALSMPPLGYTVVANPRVVAALFAIGVLGYLSYLHDRHADELDGRGTLETDVLLVAAHGIALVAAISEIAVYWALRDAGDFGSMSSNAMRAAALVTAGSTLAWLGLRRDRISLHLIGGALIMAGTAAMVGGLAATAPAGYRLVLNPRALSAMYVVAILAGLSRLHRLNSRSTGAGTSSGVFVLAANLVAMALFTAEINAYWNARGEGLSDRLAVELARTTSLVTGWLLFATSIVQTAFRRRATWLRVAGLFLVTIAIAHLVLMLLRVTPAMPPAPAGYTVVANARVIAALVAIGVLWHLSRLHHRHASVLADGGRAEITVMLSVAHGLALLAAISETEVFWALHNPGPLGAMSSDAMRAAAIAVTGGSLVRLGLRRSADDLRLLGALLLVVAAGWMAGVLVAAAPEGYHVALNARAVSSLMLIGILCYVAAAMRRLPLGDVRAGGIGASVLAACVFTFLLLTAEINAFWVREAGRAGYLARQMTLSIVWAAYAFVLVAGGMKRDYAPVRYLAIGILGLTIAKVFFVDLSELDQIYRIASAVGLGVLLTVTSFLYQRKRKASS